MHPLIWFRIRQDTLALTMIACQKPHTHISVHQRDLALEMAQVDNSINQQGGSDEKQHYRFGAAEIGIIVASCIVLVSFFVTLFYIRRLQRRRQRDMEFRARQRDLEALYEEDCKQRVASMISDTGSGETPILKGNIAIQSKIKHEPENQISKPPLWRYINSKHPRNGSVTLVIPLQDQKK